MFTQLRPVSHHCFAESMLNDGFMTWPDDEGLLLTHICIS